MGHPAGGHEVTVNALSYFDIEAERRVLGIYINNPALALRTGISLADLSGSGGHQQILAAVLDQAESGIPGSFQHLVASLTAAGHLRRCTDGSHHEAAYLFHLRDLGQTAVLPYDLDVARKAIKAASLRRGLAEDATRLIQELQSQPDPEVMLEVATDLSVAISMRVDDNGLDDDKPLPGLRSVAELLALPEEPRQWIVPGLLARRERVILIADEGAGKSVLSRQVGACVAAGVHPFLPQAPRYAPSRVLLVDLENPAGIVRRSLAQTVHAVGGLEAIGDRYHIWNWPAGLDVRSPAGRAMLTRAIEQTRPDLLLIGPLYKMSEPRSSETYEEQAKRTATALDGLIARYGCAMWIEHHSAKPGGDGRRANPFGSSLWMRWPEYGLRMEQPGQANEPNVYPLGRFRGDREARHWPDQLVRGAGRLLWSGMYEDAETEDDIVRACGQNPEQ